MLFSSLQVILAGSLIACVGYWLLLQFRRRSQSWEGIISQLRCNDWGIEEISPRFLYKSDVQATPANVWERIQGSRGLWAMYKNCPVLIQVADYAAEHGEGVNSEVLESLRRDAFQIRLHVISALAQYLYSASSAGAAVEAHRAVSSYNELLVQLTAFIQEYSTPLFPSYLSAVA